MLSSFVPLAVLGSSGVLYDIDKLNYLGSPTSGEPYIFVSRKEARLGSIDKPRSASGVRIGAQSVGHNLYNIGRILAYVLAMKEPKFVTGFAQGAEVNLAMMQGEIDARWTIQATLVRESPDWIDKKLMDFHIVNEVPKKGRRHPHPVFAHLPDIERLTKSEKGAQASCHAKSLCQCRNSVPLSAGNSSRQGADPPAGDAQNFCRSRIPRGI